MKDKYEGQGIELTGIINDYMISKGWTIVMALDFMLGVLVKSAVMADVRKETFDLQCDNMKEMFTEMQEKNFKEIFDCDLKNPLVKSFYDALKKSRRSE